MTEQVMELVQALGGAGQDEEMLRTLCAAACRTLDRRLKDGLTAEDCDGVYPLAAAWMAMAAGQPGDGGNYLADGGGYLGAQGGWQRGRWR